MKKYEYVVILPVGSECYVLDVPESARVHLLLRTTTPVTQFDPAAEETELPIDDLHPRRLL